MTLNKQDLIAGLNLLGATRKSFVLNIFTLITKEEIRVYKRIAVYKLKVYTLPEYSILLAKIAKDCYGQ